METGAISTSSTLNATSPISMFESNQSKSIAPHVVEPIRIELARHHRAIEVLRSVPSDQVRNVFRKAAAESLENFADLTLADQLVTERFVVGHFELEPLACSVRSIRFR